MNGTKRVSLCGVVLAGSLSVFLLNGMLIYLLGIVLGLSAPTVYNLTLVFFMI